MHDEEAEAVEDAAAPRPQAHVECVLRSFFDNEEDMVPAAIRCSCI
jgi:hypothetical protein